VFAQPTAPCGGLCDGSLLRPFQTIQQALNAINHLIHENKVVLLPGTYSGLGNVHLVPPNSGILFTLYEIPSLYGLCDANLKAINSEWDGIIPLQQLIVKDKTWVRIDAILSRILLVDFF